MLMKNKIFFFRMHFDPLGTSAWNTLLVGHKRWCLFPPSTPHKIIDPKIKGVDHEAVSWFTHVFPTLVKVNEDQESYAEKFGMVQVLQKPGETMYVPGGWYHVVMNLGKFYNYNIYMYIMPQMSICVR